MNTSIEKQETFIKNTAALHEIEVRIRMHIQEARRNCLEVGICLCKAKDSGLVPYGRWEKWVCDNTGLSKRQAERLMAAAREVPEDSTLAKLDMSKITEILALPEPERESMAERAVAEDMTVKQLREEIARERKRSDIMISKYNKVNDECRTKEAKIGELERAFDEFQKTADRQREEAALDHKHELEALQSQLVEALAVPAGISREAQERIDKLTQAIAELEAYAEDQARLRQEAQQELLNTKVARGGESDPVTFGPQNLEAAVRVFMGEVGVMLYMGTEIAAMSDIAKAGMRKQLSMMEDWLRRVQQLVDTRVTVIE